MNEKLKITNDVEYITYTLRIPKYKIVDYKFAQSNAYLQTELIHQLQQENQQLKEENEELKLIIGLRQKRNLIRKFDEEYDAEDKKKNPNRTYAGIMPDAEVVYQRYYKLKEVIEEVREYINNNTEFEHDGDDYGYTEWVNIKPQNIVFTNELLQILDKAKETIK